MRIVFAFIFVIVLPDILMGQEFQKGDTIKILKCSTDKGFQFVFNGSLVTKNYKAECSLNDSFFVLESWRQAVGNSQGKEAWILTGNVAGERYSVIYPNAIKAGEAEYGVEITQSNNINYTASNGITYGIGDTIKLGRGSAPNGDFRYLNNGGFGAILIYNPSRGSEQFDVGRYYSGQNVIISKIKKYHYKGAQKVVFAVRAAYTPIRFDLYIEDAITTCEVLPCGSISSNQTTQLSLADEIKKLKELKDNGVLTEEEFQQAKQKLLSK